MTKTIKMCLIGGITAVLIAVLAFFTWNWIEPANPNSISLPGGFNLLLQIGSNDSEYFSLIISLLTYFIIGVMAALIYQEIRKK